MDDNLLKKLFGKVLDIGFRTFFFDRGEEDHDSVAEQQSSSANYFLPNFIRSKHGDTLKKLLNPILSKTIIDYLPEVWIVSTGDVVEGYVDTPFDQPNNSSSSSSSSSSGDHDHHYTRLAGGHSDSYVD